MIFCEPKSLLFSMSEVPEGDYMVPIGKANVVRDGTDVTLVGVGARCRRRSRPRRRSRSEARARTCSTCARCSRWTRTRFSRRSARTGRLVVVDEATPRCGIASDVAALCVDRGFDFLHAPVKRVTAPHSPVPFSPALEDVFMPTAERVVAAVAEMG